MENHDGTDDGAVTIADWCGRVLNFNTAALTTDEQMMAVVAQTAPLAQTITDRIVLRSFGALVPQTKHTIQWAPAGDLVSPPGILFRHRIHVDDVAFGVGREHAIPDRLKRDLGPNFFQVQRVF